MFSPYTLWLTPDRGERKKEKREWAKGYYYRIIAHIWLMEVAKRTSLFPFVCIFEHPPLRR